MRSFYKLKAFSTILMLTILVSLIVIGCKKNDPVDDNTPPAAEDIKTPVDIAPTTGTRDQLTKDSIFLYARQIYFWWNSVPEYSTFNPRSYPSFGAELYAITRFGINPLTNKPYEFNGDANGADTNTPKYSYISDRTQQNPVASVSQKQSSVDLLGNGNDFGLLVKPYGSETSYMLYVQAVYDGSPAEKAGFKRGDRFDIINGTKIGTNYNGEYGFFYNALFNSSTITIGGKTSSNVAFNRSLNEAVYKSSPIYKDSIYTAGSKKIGYMAYARFSSESNSLPEFDRVFNKFSQQGVTDLIIDLRYNGGGYVTTAQNLINRIAPSSLGGKVMFIEYYNKLMQAKKATILTKQPLLDGNGRVQYQNGKMVTYADLDFSVSANTNRFQKVGSLNSVQNVVFIVSASTASASELMINSLKPHMNVKVVGATSYGKPVGFFPVRIDKYDVYLSMFETQNSNGDGKYYAGIIPDTGTSTADNDNPNYDFGDTNEASFAAAFNYLVKGTYTSDVKTTNTILAKRVEILSFKGKSLDDIEFKGMIQSPNKLKLLQ